jgi:hypothetical protein
MNDLKNWQQSELPLVMSNAEINKMADAYLDYTLRTSVQAYHSVNHSKKERQILKVILDAGDRGIISSEIQQKLPHMPYGSVTSSFKKLTDDGVIECAGVRKNFRGRNQKVWRAVK